MVLFEFSSKILNLFELFGFSKHDWLLFFQMVQGDSQLFEGQLLYSKWDIVWVPLVSPFFLHLGKNFD